MNLLKNLIILVVFGVFNQSFKAKDSSLSSHFLKGLPEKFSKTGEDFKDKVKSYFFGRPAINGVEVLKEPNEKHLLQMLSNYQHCAIDKSILFDFGLTHETDESFAKDSYKNLVLPWKRMGFKSEAYKYFKPVETAKLSAEAIKANGIGLSVPGRIIVQFGPETPSSIGNFIFSVLSNFDLNEKNDKTYYKIDSLAFNASARGFFGDQSGWLKNIELIFQLGCNYDLQNGFSRYEFHRYDEIIEKDKTALAATINEYYFAFEGAMGIFYQHSSNRFRSGVYWTNNNYFTTNKSSVILSNGAKKEDIKDFTVEFGEKIDQLAKQTNKLPKIFSEFGALAELNFFNSSVSLGCALERIYLSEPDMKEKLNLKTKCFCVSPYAKFAFNKWNGTVGWKNFLVQDKEEDYKLIGQALNCSLQMNF